MLGLTIKNYETYEFITTTKSIFLTKIGQITLKHEKIKANKNESIRFLLI